MVNHKKLKTYYILRDCDSVLVFGIINQLIVNKQRKRFGLLVRATCCLNMTMLALILGKCFNGKVFKEDGKCLP